MNSELLDNITSSLATLALNAEPEVYSPVGQACICKYSADNCFYRYCFLLIFMLIISGIIIPLCENKKCVLVFIEPWSLSCTVKGEL